MQNNICGRELEVVVREGGIALSPFSAIICHFLAAPRLVHPSWLKGLGNGVPCRFVDPPLEVYVAILANAELFCNTEWLSLLVEKWDYHKGSVRNITTAKVSGRWVQFCRCRRDVVRPWRKQNQSVGVDFL